MNTFADFYRMHKNETDAILLDIDGTVLIGRNIIGNSVEFIDELHENNTPFFFLTNDGNHSLEEKCSFLNHCGINAVPSEIISCSSVLKKISSDNNYHGKKFFIMGDLGNPPYAAEAGIIECRNIDEINECAGVINGEGDYDWHNHMEAVLGFFVDHPDAPYIVPNPDSYWPNSKTGKFGVGAGGQARFIRGLLNEMGIKIELTYLGKPYTGIYDYTISLLKEKHPDKKIDLKRIYGIGDYLKSDIKGAKAYGINSVLVLSGVTQMQHVETADISCLPDMIFDRLS